MSLLLSLFLLAQSSGETSELPLVPDAPVNSRYQAVEGAPHKTEAELKASGMVLTGNDWAQYKCKSSCLTVQFLHGRFYGKEQSGQRILYVCPNPAKNVELGGPAVSAARHYPDGWECYSIDDVKDSGRVAGG